MSGKTGKRITGRKPSGSKRMDAKTNGAFGKEGIEQVKKGSSTNRDSTVIKATDRQK